MTKQQPQIKVHHILLPASQLATLLSQQQICTKHPNPNQMAILLINSRIGKKEGEKNWLNFSQVYQTLKPCFSQLKISQQIRIRKIREWKVTSNKWVTKLSSLPPKSLVGWINPGKTQRLFKKNNSILNKNYYSD